MIRSVLTLILTFGCILSLPSYAAGNFGADRHVARGVQCQQCHGANNEVKDPDKTQCIVCHDPNAVAAKTANVKPKNPHVSPHYGKDLDCVLCHVQHDQTENYCEQCHNFGFKVP